jgi:hypothetical protein
MSVAGVRDRLVARVQELHATGGDIAAERRSLESEARKLTTSIDNIGLAIERGAGSIDSLAERLASRERELKLVRSRLEELASRESQRADLPSPDELLVYLESLRADLIAGDRRAPVILRIVLDGPIRAVFIRAPWVERIGPGVEVLARAGEHIVAVRQGPMLATAFHPEVTGDRRVHKLFVDMVTGPA